MSAVRARHGLPLLTPAIFDAQYAASTRALGRWTIDRDEEPRWLKIEAPRRDYALVVPIKDESTRLHGLVRKMEELQTAGSVDVILVDGGSRDDSINNFVLESAGINTVISFSSKGLSEQLRTGFKFCLDRGYHGIITIDGNGKDDPRFISQMISLLKEGYDFVQASRYVEGGKGVNTPWLRHWAIRYFHAPLLSYASGFAWTDTTQGYRAYSRNILLDERVSLFREIFMTYEILAYCNYRLPRLGYRCIELPVVRTYPTEGMTPTKIKGIYCYWSLIKILISACLGRYNPKGN